ncbi:hypothetical protein [Rhodococcus pyridinivorans]|uniref:hypothetical protein n=1 Tax=Rhodococcus pyridinivorans TaxID=103816 RepID=UPI00265A2C3D|nr:hypothetical protein [Rhodococcus pyridinivorans]
MNIKTIAGVTAVVFALLILLTVVSIDFVNHAVELGFLTGVEGRKVFEVPFSGGIGVGLINLIPISGLALLIGSAAHAVTGIPWQKSTHEAEA